MTEALGDRDLFGNISLPPATCILNERYIISPFSVLNCRDGEWQERKRRWISLGIKSEIGRGDNVTYGDSPEITTPGLNFYRDKNSGRSGAKVFGTEGNISAACGTSIFDPVLCEIIYKWFCPLGGGYYRSIRRRKRAWRCSVSYGV